MELVRWTQSRNSDPHRILEDLLTLRGRYSKIPLYMAYMMHCPHLPRMYQGRISTVLPNQLEHTRLVLLTSLLATYYFLPLHNTNPHRSHQLAQESSIQDSIYQACMGYMQRHWSHPRSY
jgi:hypothetical protein